MTRSITNRPLFFSLLAPAALLVAPLLLGCEDVFGPQMKCYYQGGRYSTQIRIECTTEEKTEPWDALWTLCGNTETLDDCEDWLRRQGIAA